MKGGDELGPLPNHFYVQMDGTSMQKMRIPKKFAKLIEGSVSENIEIEGPSGNIWHVKLIRSSDTFILKSDRVEESNNSSVRVVPEPHHTVKTEAITLSSGSDTESVGDVSSRSARGRTRERVRCKRKRRDTVEELSESNEGNIPVRKTAKQKCPKKNFSSYMVPKKTYLTRAQEEIADKMARQAQKGSYLFVKILTLTNCGDQRNCVLNLPTGFASKVFRSKNLVITLLPANLDKSKGCNAKYNKRTNMRCISWRKFMHKNGLKEGDLCLFELRKQQMQGNLVLTMLVHFEATEKSTKMSVGFGSASRGEGKKKITSPSSGSDTNSHSEIPSRARVLKRKRKDYVQESNDSDEGTHKTSRPYIIPSAGNTRPGGNFTLNLPCGFASEVLRTKKRIITLVRADVEKRSKEYTANYRKNGCARYIGKGWAEFVSANRLKEGEFCLFELRKERKEGKLVLTMMVHFDRK